MWNRKAEWLPWYHARNYKGDLTEAEKRQFDAFRMQPTHPAVKFDDLPEELRDYIIRIDLELYDHKQDAAAGRAFFYSAIGAALLFLNYKGFFGAPTIWSYAAGLFVLVVPWFFYRYQWNKNAEEFLPKKARPPGSVYDERIRQEWELNYICRSRQAERDGASSD